MRVLGLLKRELKGRRENGNIDEFWPEKLPDLVPAGVAYVES